MKITEKLNNVKDNTVVKAKGLGMKAKEAIDDNPDVLMYGFWSLLMTGLVITYGQSIHYMHMLNKEAKKGIFHFIPGVGRV